MNHHADARQALTEARRILDRRPPRRVARQALALRRADTLIALAQTHILAAHAGIDRPDANGDNVAAWLRDTPANGHTDVNAEGAADLIRGIKAALRVTEAERDQARDEASGLLMQLRAIQNARPQPEEARR